MGTDTIVGTSSKRQVRGGGSAPPEKISPRRLYEISLVLWGAAALAIFFADIPLLALMRRGIFRGDIAKLIQLSEFFAHGIGVSVILLSVWVLDPARRRALPRLVACSLGAGMAANVVKLVIGRMRPRDHDFATVWETFQGFGAGIFSGDLRAALDSSFHAFPSAHVATSAGLAAGLSYFYPRGRWLFAALAVLTALQRLQAGSHFSSDTFAGAAVGCLFAALCCDPRRWGKWFDRWEVPLQIRGDGEQWQ
jgi:membrane-associated phospholipid phosphatase